MRGRVALLALLAGPAQADQLSCRLADGTALSFAIDRGDFALPQDPKDPPRRAVTWVSLGAQTFAAEPFLIGPVRGFHAPASAGGMMFSVQADGRATLADMQSGTTRTGTCEDL